MESVHDEKAVLLGLAEIKAPFKNLTADERNKIVHICYRKLLDIEFSEENNSLETNLKCIGVVDSFYALQEVIFSIKQNDECFLYRKAEVILKHTIRDVVVALPAPDYQSRIIIVSRTQNFGRTLLVIQLQSNEAVKTLVTKLITQSPDDEDIRAAITTKPNGVFRRSADSFGKAMGKKVNNLFGSLASEKIEQPCEPAVPCKPETSECSVVPDDDDDDDINSDSEQDDSCDTVVVKSVIVNSLYEPRPSFDRNLLSPLEAEIQYLTQSEIGFVESLKRLLNFKNRLENTSSGVNKKQIDIMFKFVDELYIIHKELLESLKFCETDVAFICNLFKENSENFRHHINYISNISAAEKIYSIHQEGFRQSNPHIGEDLRKPRMRMNHYILTLDSLKKSCEEHDVQLLQDVILMFKEYLREADTRLVTDSVVLCPFNLMDYGYLIFNGELSLRKGEGISKKHYFVLLLEKMLVLTRGNQSSSEYVTSFHLKDIVLVHDLRGVMIHLKVKTNRQKTILVIFKVQSVKLQQKWIEKLKTQLNIVKKEYHEKQLKEQIYIKSSTKSDQSCEREKSSGSFKTSENFIMPPITMKMSFKNIYQNLRAQYSKENLLLCMKDIQETEKLLIKNMEHILCQNISINLTKLNDVKQAYEFHLRYLYPATTFDKAKFDIHIINSFDKHRSNFIKISERMLYHAAVTKYEGIECKLSPIFELFVDNFFTFRIYLCNIPLNFIENVKISSKEMENIFEDVRKNLAHFLKLKYITNIPSPFSENIVMEGLLSVKESLEHEDNKSYIIITRLKTYFLSFTNDCFNIYTSFININGKFGHPTGLKSFQIKFTNPGQPKRKFNFTSTDVETKSKWIESFRIVLPQESKGRRRARSEERIPKHKVFPSISVERVSPSRLQVKVKLNQQYIESHL